MRLRRLSWTALIVLCVVVFIPAAAAFVVPANDGFYTQTTPLLAPAQEAEIERVLEEYERATSNQIAFLVVESLGDEPPEEVALTIGRSWGVGAQGKDNGILILIATADHVIRMDVGYGLEGAVPDLIAKAVAENDMAPAFREARYAEGILAGIDALKKHIGGEYTAERYAEQDDGFGFPFLIFLFFVGVNFGGAWLGRSKSWWLGGVLGGILGVILTILFTWWLSIPALVLIGLLFDYIVSRHPPRSGRRGGHWGGGFGGGRGGGGGFGGFGGGSFGGGGATSRW